jgi:hypothetical protein
MKKYPRLGLVQSLLSGTHKIDIEINCEINCEITSKMG